MTVQGRIRLDVGIRYARALPSVRVSGDLDHDSVRLVLDALGSVVAAGCPARLVALDLGGVTSCDLPALEAVEHAAGLLAEDGRELVLHSAPDVVVRLIEETGVAARLARH